MPRPVFGMGSVLQIATAYLEGDGSGRRQRSGTGSGAPYPSPWPMGTIGVVIAIAVVEQGEEVEEWSGIQAGEDVAPYVWIDPSRHVRRRSWGSDGRGGRTENRKGRRRQKV